MPVSVLTTAIQVAYTVARAGRGEVGTAMDQKPIIFALVALAAALAGLGA